MVVGKGTISHEAFANPAVRVSIFLRLSTRTVGLHFCKMSLKYSILMHLVLDCSRFPKFIVFSPCKPGAVKKITKIFCHSFASCVLLRNKWAINNR